MSLIPFFQHSNSLPNHEKIHQEQKKLFTKSLFHEQLVIEPNVIKTYQCVIQGGHFSYNEANELLTLVQRNFEQLDVMCTKELKFHFLIVSSVYQFVKSEIAGLDRKCVAKKGEMLSKNEEHQFCMMQQNQLKNELAKLETNLVGLKSRLDYVKRDITSTNRQIENLKQEIEEIERTRTNAGWDIIPLRGLFDGLLDRGEIEGIFRCVPGYSQLKAGISYAFEDLEGAKRRVSRLRSERDSLEYELTDVERNVTSKRYCLNQANSELNQKDREAHDLELEVQKLATRLTDLRNLSKNLQITTLHFHRVIDNIDLQTELTLIGEAQSSIAREIISDISCARKSLKQLMIERFVDEGTCDRGKAMYAIATGVVFVALAVMYLKRY